MLMVAPAGVSLARPDQGSSRIWQVKPQGERKTVLKHPVELIKTIAPLKNSPHRSLRFLLIPLALVLACFALSQRVHGVVPAPDGGYPNGNTAEGQDALFSLTTGGFNTAVGFLSLRSNTTGEFNTGIGAGTLFVNTSFGNTATGAGALLSDTTRPQNTANGALALFSNITGGLNTATGYGALYNNMTGSTNTANGRQALFDNTTGIRNTALSVNAGYNVTGSGNVCIGADVLGVAGVDNTTWIGNIYTTVQQPA